MYVSDYKCTRDTELSSAAVTSAAEYTQGKGRNDRSYSYNRVAASFSEGQVGLSVFLKDNRHMKLDF